MNTSYQKGFTVLIVGRDFHLLDNVALTLTNDGFDVVVITGAAAAFEELGNRVDVGVVVVDARTSDMDGLDFIEAIRTRLPAATRPRSILIAAHGTVDMVVRSMRLGAFDFLNMPVEDDELVKSVRNAMSAWMTAHQPTARMESGSGELLAARAMQIRAALRERRARILLFSSRVLMGQGWEILLELALADLEGRRPTVAELCNRIPISMALRIVDRFVRSGLAEKHGEPADPGQFVLGLTETGRERLIAYFDYMDRHSKSAEEPTEHDCACQHAFDGRGAHRAWN